MSKLAAATVSMDEHGRVVWPESIQGHRGAYARIWAPDGRATYTFGEAVRPGEPHVSWRRVGSRDILSEP